MTTGITNLDWGIIAAYMLGVVGIGVAAGWRRRAGVLRAGDCWWSCSRASRLEVVVVCVEDVLEGGARRRRQHLRAASVSRGPSPTLGAALGA